MFNLSGSNNYCLYSAPNQVRTLPPSFRIFCLVLFLSDEIVELVKCSSHQSLGKIIRLSNLLNNIVIRKKYIKTLIVDSALSTNELKLDWFNELFLLPSSILCFHISLKYEAKNSLIHHIIVLIESFMEPFLF